MATLAHLQAPFTLTTADSMRILFVSNVYPPLHIGGYELCCADAVSRLGKRGHDTCVLTSTYGLDAPATDGHVFRWLKSDLGRAGAPFEARPTQLLTRTSDVLRKEFINRRAFLRLVNSFKPNLLYLWNLTHISVTIGMHAQRIGLPTCYHVGDLWLSNWKSDSWVSLESQWFPEPTKGLTRTARATFHQAARLFGLPISGSLDLRHVQFVSGYLKNETLKAGQPVAEAEVVHWGIDLEMFPVKPDHNGPLKLLFVGQIVWHKGLDTAIEALANLKAREGYSSLKLSIVGGSVFPDYVIALRAKARALGLEDNVEFLGELPHEQLPEIYHQHDILLFPSFVDEGLGMSMLEAMASGLVVVGTASGGSAEVLVNEQTGLTFPKHDASACAEQVFRLLEDRSLYNRIRRRARLVVEEDFEIEKIMNRLEISLQAAIDARI
jgi:glycosyltransferase involved in cell wall biosynthesis